MKYDINVDILCKEYLEGVSVQILAQKHNCNPEIIYNRLKKSNNDSVLDYMRKRTQHNYLINEDHVVYDYISSDISVEDISKKYKCSKERIKHILNSNIRNKDVFRKLYKVDDLWSEKYKEVMHGYWELDFGKNKSDEYIDRLDILYRVYGVPKELHKPIRM